MKVLIGAMVAAGAVLAAPAQADEALAKKHNCLACHQLDKKSVGPAYKDVAKKYAGNAKAEAMLVLPVPGVPVTKMELPRKYPFPPNIASRREIPEGTLSEETS